MRPAGEIRRALRSLLDARQPTTWRSAAVALHERGVLSLHSPSELRLVRNTLLNMTRAGELQVCGHAPVPGVRRPMALYAPCARWATDPAPALDVVMRAWAR